MCLHRTYWEEWEKTHLAPYASKCDDDELTRRPATPPDYKDIKDPAGSESRYRTSFQIDKDRILSSTAFRRLEYKTQIFVNHEGDNYRTRLTHTTEVSSIARRIAKAMRLNEDLVEAIALGHDLGHTPFGHAGEEALNEWGLLGRYGFYHNVHGLRIVDELEEGYDWDKRKKEDGGGSGLNLTYAVREGILKHTTRGFREGDKRIFNERQILNGIDPDAPSTLEAQVVALADEIAQRVNDLEDGLRSGLISKDDVVKLIRKAIPNDDTKINDLIRAEKTSPIDRTIVARRRGKYLQIIDSCQEGNSPPTMANLIGLIRELWTANAIEYSHKNIKGLTEVSAEIGDETGGVYGSQITKFNTNTFEEIVKLDEIKTVNKLEQDRLKLGKKAVAEFCEIDIFIHNKKPTAHIKIIEKTLKRDINSEKLIPIGAATTLNEITANKYFIKWIASDMAVWRTQRVLVLAEAEGKEVEGIYKNYPIEQVKIKIREKNVISFSDEMAKIDKEFKRFIELKIHRSSKVARMNTKGVELVKKIFNRFLDNPFQLPKNVLGKYPNQNLIDDNKKISEIDNLIRNEADKDAFKQLVAEHIAGMTDRFLINEYERLFLISKDIEEKEEKSFSD
jgi:predicted deoxyguanosinetriphosphate triphosphohydrolase